MGILVVCQVLAVLLQGLFFACIHFQGDAENAVMWYCTFVGLGGVQKAFLDENLEEEGAVDVVRGVCIGIPETLPGLIFQPSLFALTFAYSGAASQQKQLLSLAISWLMTLKAIAAVLRSMRHWNAPPRSPEGVALVIFYLGSIAFVVGAFGAVMVGMSRVYHAFECEDHLWNIFSGCVEL